jgi:1-acyl-sn-glycerol-3-phosphate acyltransferase
VGTFAIAPPGAKLPRPHKIKVRFGSPMPPIEPDPSAEQLREWTDELMARICVLSEQEFSGVDAVGRE